FSKVREVLFRRIIPQLGLFLRVQMVQVPKKLVEPMHCRQVLISVAQMVLPELTGGVALGLQQLGNCRIFCTDTDGCTRKAYLAQTRAEHALAGDECGPPRGAALLAVAIGEQHTFVGNAVDIGSLVAHHATTVAAEIPVADVISPYNEDVWFSVR